jgi:hypothetical protein
LIERVPAGRLPYTFWPPPPASSVWTVAPTGLHDRVTLREAETRIARALRSGGYTDLRRYPIGLRYVHGFALVTRLEAIDDEAAPRCAGREHRGA